MVTNFNTGAILDAILESEVLTTENDVTSLSYNNYAITVGAKEEQNIPSLSFIVHNCIAGDCALQVSS